MSWFTLGPTSEANAKMVLHSGDAHTSQLADKRRRQIGAEQQSEAHLSGQEGRQASQHGHVLAL